VHFQIELCAIGFSIQPKKCVAWSPFCLSLDFDTPYEGIKVLGVPLNTSSFKSSSSKMSFLNDVWHVDLFLIVGDVHVAFKILTHCFLQ
jgi:hypothetical protein